MERLFDYFFQKNLEIRKCGFIFAQLLGDIKIQNRVKCNFQKNQSGVILLVLMVSNPKAGQHESRVYFGHNDFLRRCSQRPKGRSVAIHFSHAQQNKDYRVLIKVVVPPPPIPPPPVVKVSV